MLGLLELRNLVEHFRMRFGEDVRLTLLGTMGAGRVISLGGHVGNQGARVRRELGFLERGFVGAGVERR